MREIELKFKVNSVADVINMLQEISEPLNQKDTVYVLDLNNVKSTEGSVWLRVRDTNGVVELNLKKQSSKKMESKEIEFEVNSYKKANDFLEALGYQKWVEVNKVRKHAKYKNCNICIDEVEKLGTFIEIEMLIDEEDNIDYEKKLLDIAKELNIDITNRVDSHYDTMISELDNL